MNLTVALTGASGAIFGRELLRALEADERVARVHFVASENSLRVLAEELGLSGRNDLLEKLLGAAPEKTVQHSDADIGAAIASGSYPSDGMIILPCSMGTLAAIANGLANSLIARAADVTLKERRPLHSMRARDALQPHSSAQHDAGRRSRRGHLPVIPAFYNHPIDSDRDGAAICLPRAGPHRPAAAGSQCMEGRRVKVARCVKRVSYWPPCLACNPTGVLQAAEKLFD